MVSYFIPRNANQSVTQKVVQKGSSYVMLPNTPHVIADFLPSNTNICLVIIKQEIVQD
jgi:hypothetical protein